MGNDAEVRPYVRICYSEYSVYFSWTLYILEGALMAFGAFIAWETKHVCMEFVLLSGSCIPESEVFAWDRISYFTHVILPMGRIQQTIFK